MNYRKNNQKGKNLCTGVNSRTLGVVIQRSPHINQDLLKKRRVTCAHARTRDNRKSQFVASRVAANTTAGDHTETKPFLTVWVERKRKNQKPAVVPNSVLNAFQKKYANFFGVRL